ncbi:MAG: hypothetical protein COA42_14355 [Alteromonadaceae bacterium]|nr:MAG: hypothetical protein COA42_14355 [Alteromonadaceae bacterium]
MHSLLKFLAVPALALSAYAVASGGYRHTSIEIDLPVSTQGPLWPPSEMVNADGDFILIGNALLANDEGQIGMVPNQAVLVSKDTIPPLDENGVEDPDNWFGAPYKVIRELDLSEGSADMNQMLYANSFGPVAGSGGTPRIPREGESAYNLNKDFAVCRDVFPTDSQVTGFYRDRLPLHEVPILGFQGDNVAYDANTGEAYDPQLATSDPACAAFGCPGEDAVDERDSDAITLKDWVKSEGKLKIRLTNKNEDGDFTSARFKFRLKSMLPNSLYTVWVVRGRQIPVPGVYERRDIDAIATQNLLMTDANGNAKGIFDVNNPFPAAETDFTGRRIVGLSVVYHSDMQTWGGCFSRLGPGVDVHVVFNTLNSEADGPGLPDFTDFVTVAR